ncbi:MAG TPA: hypothetical protein VKA67_06465 [Verrucomicrobiae bacterium]|nr:hypothetical protein [Verrucomicrobiae bacterium]
MTKQHQQTLYISDESAATLKKLAAALGTANQRGEHSIGALNEWIARTAAGGFAEMVAALEIAAGCAGGEDWYELIETIRPEWSEQAGNGKGNDNERFTE